MGCFVVGETINTGTVGEVCEVGDVVDGDRVVGRIVVGLPVGCSVGRKDVGGTLLSGATLSFSVVVGMVDGEGVALVFVVVLSAPSKDPLVVSWVESSSPSRVLVLLLLLSSSVLKLRD